MYKGAKSSFFCIFIIVKPKFKCIIFLVFLVYHSYSQELSERAKRIVKNLSKYNTITNKTDDYGTVITSYLEYEELKNTLTSEELIILTNHKSPLVRCYSYKSLLERNDSSIYDVLKVKISDSEELIERYGSVRSKTTVGDYVVEITKINGVFPDKEIDSLVLFTDTEIDYRNNLLLNIEPKESFYNRIKELGLSKNSFAIVALSKFNKRSDYNLFRTFKYKNELIGMQSYNSNYFYCKVIESVHYKGAQHNLSNLQEKNLNNKTRGSVSINKALLSFKNEEAYISLLKELEFENKNGYDSHSRELFIAVQDNKDSIFQELKWRLWEERKLINTQVFQELLTLDKKRCEQIIKSHLAKPLTLFNSLRDVTPLIERDGRIVEGMLSALDEKTRIEFLKIGLPQLQYRNQEEIYLKQIAKLPYEDFTETYFKCLNSNTASWVVERIIDKEDEGLNKRLIQVIKKDTDLRKAGWLDYLKEKGIE